ncbi:hypothetical protein KUTeg_022105 [Tegillarca granosa]|uniref:Uncharacterized protein n=1 Tax=Tegillarca granosa TaxID=220873 RepID=A0ABQ9E852_TEGGR|nr:hypothetical protein KUTeg_022105 [Tegillarca granosa]
MVELKRLGLGNVAHHPDISKTDRSKLYYSLHISPETPYGFTNNKAVHRGQESMNYINFSREGYDIVRLIYMLSQLHYISNLTTPEPFLIILQDLL